MSRSATSPTCSPRLSAADSSRRASRSPTIRTPNADRVRTNQSWSAGSPTVSIGRDDPLPGAGGEVEAGQLDRPEVAADEDRRDGPGEGRVDVVRVLDVDPPVEDRRVEAGRPEDLEVVAGVVPERRADEPLERPRVGRGGARPGVGRALVGELARDAPEVAPRLRRALRREPVGERRRPTPARATSGRLREPAGEPRGANRSRARTRWPRLPRPSPRRSRVTPRRP